MGTHITSYSLKQVIINKQSVFLIGRADAFTITTCICWYIYEDHDADDTITNMVARNKMCFGCIMNITTKCSQYANVLCIHITHTRRTEIIQKVKTSLYTVPVIIIMKFPSS